MVQDQHPWYFHPPSFSYFWTLSCCEITVLGSRSYARYSSQSWVHRVQSGTLLKTISAIDILKSGQDRHPWYFHPPSFSCFWTLSCCEITVVGSKSSAWYSYQSYESRVQAGTLLNTISAIDILQCDQDLHPWYFPPPSFSYFSTFQLL